MESCTLFFSEYAEGSSNNKYLEIFNPGLTEVSLATMALAHTVNAPATPGTYETWVEFPANSTVAAGNVFRIVHTSAAPELLNSADFIYGNLSNGDDGFALVVDTPTDFVILDIIGDWNGDPGSGWDVAGTANATQNHTLVRKLNVLSGNAGDWPFQPAQTPTIASGLCSKSTIGPISANTPSTVNATRAAKTRRFRPLAGLHVPQRMQLRQCRN